MDMYRLPGLDDIYFYKYTYLEWSAFSVYMTQVHSKKIMTN